MHTQSHIQTLLAAQRHLETFAKSQLGAAGDELLDKFRQTVDFLSGDLASSDALREHVQTLAANLIASDKKLADTMAQMQTMLNNAEAAPPPAPDGQVPAVHEVVPVEVTNAAGAVSSSYNELLVKMRGFGEMPPELETLIQEVSASVAALTTLTEQPTPSAPIENTDGQAPAGG